MIKDIWLLTLYIIGYKEIRSTNDVLVVLFVYNRLQDNAMLMLPFENVFPELIVS